MNASRFSLERDLQVSLGMNQWREEMKARTHTFAVCAIRLLRTIPDRTDTRRIKDQLLEAATGVGLN